MADENAVNKLDLAWYLYVKKRNVVQTEFKDSFYLGIPVHEITKRRIVFIKAVLIACLHCQRTRILWMHPRSLIWFEMVDETYNDEL